MNCIQVNKDYRITSDSRQWRVERYSGRNKQTGGEVWAPITYHANFNQLVTSLAMRLVRELDVTTIDELKEAAKTIRNELESIGIQGLEE